MELLGKIKNLAQRILHPHVDVITCAGSKDLLLNAFSSPATIKNGAKLVVDNSHIAALVRGGRIADIYGSGQHELVASNMPIFATLKGWKSNYHSDFEAEVYFVNTSFREKEWATPFPFPFEDDQLKSVAIESSGTCSFSIMSNPSMFIKKIIEEQSAEYQEEWLNKFITTELRKYLEISKPDLLYITKNPKEFSKEFSIALRNSFLDYDIVLDEYCIEKFIIYKN